MKNFKRILAAVLAVMFVVTTAAVSVFAGAASGKWYNDAVEYLDNIGVSNIGTTAGEALDRDEFVTWIAKIESHQLYEDAWNIWEYTANATFTDVSDSDHKGAIGHSVNRGFIVGNGDGTFTPNAQITLAEAAAVVVRVMGFSSRVTGDDWAVNSMYVANTYCGAFDETFLTETKTFDPEYKLTKGEGAYILYSIMNGKHHTECNGTCDCTLNKTFYNIDLGEWFANSKLSTVRYTMVVTNVPMAYTQTTQQFRRYDALLAGASYDSIFADDLYQSNGVVDTNGYVTLTSVDGTYTTVISVADFMKKVVASAPEGTFYGQTASDELLAYAGLGKVVRIAVASSDKGATTLSASQIKSLAVLANADADTYIGYATLSNETMRKDASTVGWKYAAANTVDSSSNVYTRMATGLNWTNVTYNANGTVKNAQLVVGDKTYEVVTAYTGAANEIKVFAPAGIFANATKAVVSVVGDLGDTVYAGARFEDLQAAKLNATDAAYVVGGVATETFTLSENYNDYIAYELDVKANFVTSTTFNLSSDFVVDGRLDLNTIDMTAPLTDAQAMELILAPAQGESAVILSDTDGDGNYDIAVVTESSRALYYGEVNSSVDPANEGYYGGLQDMTREVYTSFGDYVMAVRGLKGHNIGGLVVDKTVAYGGTTNGGTDGWNLTSTKATDAVQLVICFSNERQIYGGNNDTTQYGTSAVYPYTTVTVAELTTAYIKEVSANKAVVAGQQCYVATVVDTNNAVKTVYIPVAPKASITLPVTVDGITSNVTFNAGESLLSFVTDHDTTGNIGASTGTWMAGHTVKYVADENGVAWCMKETATSGAVTGYVASVAKSATGDNTYNVTVVANAETSTGTTTYDYTVDNAHDAAVKHLRPFGTQIIFNQYGVDAVLNNEVITVYQIQAGLDAALIAAGTSYNTYSVAITHNTGDDYTTGAKYAEIVAAGLDIAPAGIVTVAGTVDNGDGTTTTTLTCKFPNAANKLFPARSGNAPVTGLYVDTNGKYQFKATDYAGGATANSINRYFAEGTMISAADYNLYVKGGAFETYFAEVTGNYETLLGAINWNKVSNTKFTTSYKSGTSAKTLQVKASATAVWQYDAATYNLVHNVLVKGTLVNNDTFLKDTVTGEYVRPIVSARDLVYLSFASDAGSYYTIEGKHTASYEQNVVTGENWGTGVKTSQNNANLITSIDPTSAGNNYRTRGFFAWYYDETATGAATDGQWTNGFTGDFASDYILTYNKTSATKTFVDNTKTPAPEANAAGYYDVYDMIVGTNPYYEKVTRVNALGKTYDSYELMFTTVESYSDVKGYTWFEIDPTKTILVELLTQDKKQNVVDDGVSYTDTTKFYVDPTTKYVYQVFTTDLVYTTKAINATPEYDITGAVAGTVLNNVVAATIDVDDATAGVQGAKDNLASLTVREMKADEAGFVPGTYFVTLEGKGTFKMGENVKIVVAHPNATTGNMDITVTSPKGIATANEGKGTTVFVTDFQYVGNAEVCTFLSVIGNVNTPVKSDSTVVVESNESLTAGTKLVYLNGSVDVIANAEEVGNYWVLRSTGAAIDVTTGEEVGTIQYIFNTYKESTMSDASIALRAGGYFLVDGNNEVQAVVGEAGGVYTNGLAEDDDNYAAAKVYNGQIVNVTADGKTTAILNYTGAEDDVKEDVSDLEFVFIYHDMDNDNFGIGGKSTNVSVLDTAGIKATYKAYEDIVAEGAYAAAHMYTPAMVEAAAEQLAAAKEAAIANYLNGTFWNVEYSPVYNKFLTEKVSYQNAQPTLNFSYVVIGGTYFVFVNSF